MTLTRISVLVIAMISTIACWNSDPTSPNGAANRVIWSSALRGSVSGEVAATTELVFATTDSGLAAIERASGHERWFSPVQGLAGSKRLLVRGGRVLSAGVYSVQANDAVTGAVLWQRVFDVNTAAPDFSDLAADDVALFVGLRDGRALALAQSDGSVLWEAAIATSDWTFKGLIGGR